MMISLANTLLKVTDRKHTHKMYCMFTHALERFRAVFVVLIHVKAADPALVRPELQRILPGQEHPLKYFLALPVVEVVSILVP